MTITEYTAKLDFYTNELGTAQVKLDEAYRWGFQLFDTHREKLKKSFIYLNTLSRYNPEGYNTVTEQQVNFIFLQLDKLRLAI